MTDFGIYMVLIESPALLCLAIVLTSLVMAVKS